MRTELLSLIAKKMNVNGLKSALLVTALLMFWGVSWGQGTEGFESYNESSYYTGTSTIGTGDWDFVSVFKDGAANSGSVACRINDDISGASITSPSLNTVGTVTFWYRPLNAETSTFQFQKSVGGGAFTTIESISYGSSQSYVQYSYNVNEGNSDVKIRILNDDQSAHLIIDDFEWTAYSSCSGEPTAQATDITTSNATATSIDVLWSAGTGGDNYILVAREGSSVSWTPTDGTDYSAQTGSGDFSTATDQSGGNKVVYASSGISTTVTGLSASTTYYFQVFHLCSNDSDNYLTSSGTNNDGTQIGTTTAVSYCDPAPSSVDNDGITNVSMGTINNSTGTETNNFGDYSAQSTDVEQGATVNCDITYETGWTYVTKIWVDWNNDGDFDDLGEEVYTGESTSSNPTTLNASFSVPAGASLGAHRLRIGGADSGPPTPCYTGSYASYEDYTINVIAASTNNTDTEAYDSGSQPAASNISSTSTAFTNVFQIEIEDQGSGDGLITDVTNIRVKPHSSNTADWTDHIADVKLNNGSDITIGSPTITDTYIDIPISAGNLQIADGGSDVITLQVQINNTGITDNAVLSFMVDADDHGFTADNSGSGFVGTFLLGDFNSNDFAIDITATELLYVQQPANTIVNMVMASDPTVEAVDANGNRDTDYSTAISITSSGTMTGDPVSGTWSNGLATFSGITHTAIGSNLTLTTSSGAFTNEVSNAFDITDMPSILITEIAGKGHGGDYDDEYIELSNTGTSTVDITGWNLKYYEGSLEEDLILSGTIAPNDAFVIAARSTYSGITPDQVASFSINNHCWIELFDNSSILMDQAGTSADKFDDGNNYEFTNCEGNNEPTANWDDLGTGNGTPGVVNCVVSNDSDTEVYDSGSQPAASNISSTSTAFTNVFQIEIEDQGSGDGLITDVTNIRVKPHSSNTADWTDHIADVKLNNGSDITIGVPTITDTYIDIPISAGNLQIADGGSDVITLQVQINNTGITDNAVLSFMIDADDHGFTADNTGSQFINTLTLGDFNSNDFTIDVTGDEIKIVQQPTDVIVNTAMTPSVTVAFTDASGNIDTDFTGAGCAIGLTTTGSFDASATTEVDAVNGVATFDNLVFDAEATDITLTTFDPDSWAWTNVTSDQFDVTPVPVAPSIYISEIAAKGYGGSASQEYIELTNSGASSLDLSGWTIEYYNNSSLETTTTLSGSVSANSAFLIAKSGSGDINGITPDDYLHGSTYMNTTQYVILKDDSNAIIDQAGSSSDKFSNDVNYEFTDCGGDNEPTANWDNLGTDNGTPGVVNCAVTDPTLLSTQSSLSGFIYEFGNGPSVEKSFDLSGLYLDGSDVTVTPPTNFEISQTSGSGFQSSAITLSAYDGTSTTIYVRLISGLAVNTYGPENITISGGGATDIDVACDGEVSLSQVTDLAINCITNTTAEISWTAPAGTYDGVIIAVRNGSDPVDDISADPSTVSSDAVFGDGYEYGAASPYSYVIYKGAGNTVTVTGLTAGEDYQIKAFVFSGTLYGDAVSTSVSNLRVRDVTAASATAGNTTAEISWTNPTNCFDDIMVVGHETSPVSSLPTGDGSSYSASSVYGSGTDIGISEFVVYQGTGFNVNLSNLTNGVTYYFTIFVREGNEWSVGVVVSVTPSNTTIFNPGELIIVGFDATIQSSAADKIYLATFVDVLPNTSFLYVNSRFEAGAAANVRTNEWHGGGTDPDEDPGIVTITYTGASTISAGSIISFDIQFAEANNFEIDGVSTTDFSSSFNGSSANISSSSGDQLWLLQGSFTDQGTYHTLDGNVLYGMTSREAWVDFSSSVDGSNSDTQRESRLHPDVECFNFELSTTQAYAYYKNGTSGTPGVPAHDANMRTLLLDVMDPSNWETGYGGGTLDIAEDFSACDVAVTENAIGRRFCVSAYSADHQWKGDIDTDWFNCANWQSLHIPNAENDVLFDSDDCYNNIELTAGDTAKCKNFTIQGAGTYDIIAAADNTKYLEVFGNININAGSTIVFDDSDSGTNDGTLLLHGNWNNTVGVNGFVEGNSTVKFVGVDNQTISSNSTTETLYNFIVNKPSGAINMNNDVECDYLDLTSGLVNTSTNLLHVLNTDPSNITHHTSASYVNGLLRRNVNASGVYDFPVGDNSNYELATVDISSSSALTYLDAHFALSDLGDLDITPLNLLVDGTPLVTVLDGGYWQIEPNTGAAVNYDIALNLAGSSNAAPIAEQHAVIKRDDAISDWELQGAHDNSTQSINGGVVTAKVSSLGAFSQFAIARSQDAVLSVELIDFQARCETAGIVIDWATASEENADYFIVEYSVDTKDWSEIQKLPAFGTTNMKQEYQLLLEDIPRVGYFRLVEVDLDGTRTIYHAEYLNCLTQNDGVELTIAPNPAADFAEIRALKTLSDFYLVTVFDATGKVVNTLGWESPQESMFKLNVSDFAPGFYTVKVFNESESHNLKLIVK